MRRGAAVAAKALQVHPALAAGALAALPDPFGCLAAATGDPAGHAGGDIEALAVALARLLNRRLGPFALGTPQRLELGAVIAGAMGVLGRVFRALQQRPVLFAEAIEVALAQALPEAALVAVGAGDQLPRFLEAGGIRPRGRALLLGVGRGAPRDAALAAFLPPPGAALLVVPLEGSDRPLCFAIALIGQGRALF